MDSSFIGISYLTFRVVQIIIEMYDGVIESISPSDFAEFLIFFPTFSCGPIDRSRRFMADSGKAYKRSEYLELFGTGIEKMAWGLLYKFVLANLAYKVMSSCRQKQYCRFWHILSIWNIYVL